jgi:hypothetical protein
MVGSRGEFADGAAIALPYMLRGGGVGVGLDRRGVNEVAVAGVVAVGGLGAHDVDDLVEAERFFSRATLLGVLDFVAEYRGQVGALHWIVLVDVLVDSDPMAPEIGRSVGLGQLVRLDDDPALVDVAVQL